MEQSKPQSGDKDAPLHEIVALAEKAARAIARLQSEVNIRNQRIKQLEQSQAALKAEADWCRWFRSKYGDSTFLSHIETTYRAEHVVEQEKPNDMTGVSVEQPIQPSSSD